MALRSTDHSTLGFPTLFRLLDIEIVYGTFSGVAYAGAQKALPQMLLLFGVVCMCFRTKFDATLISSSLHFL